MGRSVAQSSSVWASGQTIIAANESAPTLATDGIEIDKRFNFLDLRVAAIAGITAYSANLWLYMGASKTWVRVPTHALANTDAVTDGIMGIELWGAAERFDWVFSGLTVTDAAVGFGLQKDAAVFTDYTTELNSAGAADVVLLPATPAATDAFLWGDTALFSGMKNNVSTGAVNITGSWQYSKGADVWGELTILADDTNELTTTGSNSTLWTRPTDWATDTVDSNLAYWVRYYVSAVATPTTPVGTQGWLNQGAISWEYRLV